LEEFEDSLDLVRRALDGHPPSVRSLVDLLSPLIAKRVAVTLWQRSRTRDVSQDVNDLVQDIFLALFQSDGKALRTWDPGRGMSLERFVGMLAQHQVITFLRNGRTSLWRDEPHEDGQLEKLGDSATTPKADAMSRENLYLLLDRIPDDLSPRGLELFQRIVLDEEPLETLMSRTGISREVLYQWKSRIFRKLRDLQAELEGPVSETPGTRRT
jgi:RNA polymerase sigma factor (sigma-70 family)